MEIVQAAAGGVDPSWSGLGKSPWILNPPGCLLRANLLDQMDRAGSVPTIAAEIHNMHLQLAFVQAGHGLGLLPARFIRRHDPAGSIKPLRPPGFGLHMTVAIARAGHLGSLEKAAERLGRGLGSLFETSRAAGALSP
jgi:DNA-binding transcriptional LysR family regulator